MAVHPDGKRFVSAGNEPQLRWWNVDGDKPSARRGGHSGPVQQLAFSGDGRRLISAGGDGSVRLWDGKTGAPDPPAAGPGRLAIRRRDLRRRPPGGGRRLGRPGPALGRRLRPPAGDPDPAAGAAEAPAIAPRRARLAGRQLRAVMSPARPSCSQWPDGEPAVSRCRPRPRERPACVPRSSRVPCAEKPSSPSRSRPRRGSEP